MRPLCPGSYSRPMILSMSELHVGERLDHFFSSETSGVRRKLQPQPGGQLVGRGRLCEIHAQPQDQLRGAL